MNQQEVIALMNSSKTEDEWNTNADIIKKKCGGWPPFWYAAIIASGLIQEVAKRWGSDGKIHLSTL